MPDFSAKLSMFQNRLQKVWKHYSKLARRQEVACFRFYDHDLPEVPFSIDCYDGVVHAVEHKRWHGMSDEDYDIWLQACRDVLAVLTGIPADSVIIKQRQAAPANLKAGQAKQERIVPEGGLNFITNLTDFQDTGLFLEDRTIRSFIREQSAGIRVLNLFCYTGTIGVYAAHGGASAVTSVDFSRTNIHWAKRNMQFNKLYSDEKHEFIQADVMEIIGDLPLNTFDLIICDPPPVSTTKRSDESFDLQKDHVPLLKKLLKATTEDGTIYFSNNYRGFQMDRDSIPATTVKDITAAITPFDFQNRMPHSTYLLKK